MSHNTLPYFEYRKDWHRSVIDDDILESEQIFTDKSPRYKSLSKTVVELILNICEELEYSAAIEFTCLDTLDVYIGRFYQQTVNRYAQILKDLSYPETDSPTPPDDVMDMNRLQADGWMMKEMERFQETFMIRLVAVLMLSAKIIGNKTIKPVKLKMFIELLYMIGNKTVVKPSVLKATEIEVYFLKSVFLF